MANRRLVDYSDSSSNSVSVIEEQMQLLSTSSGTIIEEGEIIGEEEVFENELAAPHFNPLDQQQFMEVMGTKEKSLLTLNGFEYAYDKDSKGNANKEFYRCAIKNPYCPARIIVDSNWHIGENGRYKIGNFTRMENSQHRHGPIEGKAIIRKASQMMREGARSANPIGTSTMVNQARSSIPLPVRRNAPTRSAMRRNYQLMKRKAAEQLGDRGMDENNHQLITIPDNITAAYVLYNEMINDDQRIIIFVSEFGLNMLMEHEEIAIDGTFANAPRNFMQVYTISVLKDRVAIPVVYGILPGKSEEIYTIFFHQIKERLPDWSPNLVMSDFERASLNAVSAELPLAEQTGCLFHLGQAIHRNVNKYPHLRTLYGNPNGRIHLKSFQALAFVPPNEVFNYFTLLMESFNVYFNDNPGFEDEFLDFIWYFIITWIGCDRILQFDNAREENFGVQAEQWIRDQIDALGLHDRRALFSIELWNVTDRLENDLSRTNNSVEGWHNHFNGQLTQHPRLSVLVKKIIEEDEHWFDMINEFEINPADGIRGRGMKRRDTYVQQDQNLMTLYEQRNINNDPLRYLRAIAHHL